MWKGCFLCEMREGGGKRGINREGRNRRGREGGRERERERERER